MITKLIPFSKVLTVIYKADLIELNLGSGSSEDADQLDRISEWKERSPVHG